MDKLKPCPFCGGKAKIVDVSGGWCAVVCDKCEATSKCIVYSGAYAAEAAAIKAWNRRADNG